MPVSPGCLTTYRPVPSDAKAYLDPYSISSLQAAGSTYQTCSYTSLEVSSTLGKLQETRVSEQAGHGEHFNVEVGNASDPTAWGETDDSRCSVLAMEVLDNCPHDR